MKKKIQGRPKTAGRFAPKALQLEVGGKYMTRSGHTATILRKVDGPTCFPFRGRTNRHGGLSWQEDGSYFDSTPHDRDLVREVPGAKRPLSRKAKGSPTLVASDNDRIIRKGRK